MSAAVEKADTLSQKIDELEKKLSLSRQKTSVKYMRLLNELAEFSCNTNPKRGAELALEAIVLARAHSSDSEMIKALLTLSKAQRYLADHKAAYRNAKKALELSREIADCNYQLSAQNMLAIISHFQGEAVKSIEYFVEMYRLASQKGVLRYMIAALNNIAFFFISIKDFSRAMHYNKILEKKLIEFGSEQSMDVLLHNFADCYLQLAEYDQAIKYLRKSEKYVCPDSLISATNSFLYAEYYYHIYNLEKSVSYAELALEKFRAFDNREGITKVLLFLAEIHTANGDQARAKAYYNELVELGKSNNSQSYFKAILGLAKIHMAAKQAKKALALLDIIFETEQDEDVTAEAYLLLSQYYEENLQTDKALKFYKKYSARKLTASQKNAELKIYSCNITRQVDHILRELD